jgi:hypothetical protein
VLLINLEFMLLIPAHLAMLVANLVITQDLLGVLTAQQATHSQPVTLLVQLTALLISSEFILLIPAQIVMQVV